MKKTLVLIAALASVASVAQAQSTVQLYGIVDLILHKDKGVSAALTSGGVSGSRWGLKGSEDLGGGLKANYLLEQGFDADRGTAAAGTAFGRQAYVGFSGGFGEVKLGKVWSAYDDISGATNPVFDSVLSPTAIWASTAYQANPNNGLYYSTPTMGGLSGAVSYNLDENNAAKRNVLAFHAKYEGGPVYAGFAYQSEGDVAGSNDQKFTRLNGSYDLGVAKILAGYGKVSMTGTRSSTDLSFGADVPLGSAMVLSAGYASSKVSGGVKATGFGVGVVYSMSKRTSIYGGYVDTKRGGPDSRFGAGVKHTF